MGTVRVALYTRVSTEDQAKEGFSLGAQRERLQAYWLARDWAVVARCVDGGQPGRNPGRSGYSKVRPDRNRRDARPVSTMDPIRRSSRKWLEVWVHLGGR